MKWQINFGKERSRRSSEEIYKEMIDETEKLIDSGLKSTGVSMFEMFEELDGEQGELLGKFMESYRKIMNLCVEQAQVIDRIEATLSDIQKYNKDAHEEVMKRLYELKKA